MLGEVVNLEEALERIKAHLELVSEKVTRKVVVDPSVWEKIPEGIKKTYKDRLLSHEYASGILLIDVPKSLPEVSYGELLPKYPLPTLKKSKKRKKRTPHEK